MSSNDNQKKLNGSVDLLAQSMKQVFQESIESAVAPVEAAVTGLRKDMKHLDEKVDRLDKKIDTTTSTTNHNMQVQFAEQEKTIGQLIKGQRV